jgi:hypothetical protein
MADATPFARGVTYIECTADPTTARWNCKIESADGQTHIRRVGYVHPVDADRVIGLDGTRLTAAYNLYSADGDGLAECFDGDTEVYRRYGGVMICSRQQRTGNPRPPTPRTRSESWTPLLDSLADL